MAKPADYVRFLAGQEGVYLLGRYFDAFVFEPGSSQPRMAMTMVARELDIGTSV